MNEIRQNKKIAVVGAGVSGISSLYGILNAYNNLPIEWCNLSIDVFEAKNIGGYQYSVGPTSLEHWVNGDISAMSIGGADLGAWIYEHKEGVMSFLKEHFPNHHLLAGNLELINKLSPDDKSVYIPRVVYGLYLKNVYNSIVTKLKSCGIQVNEYKSEVIDLKQSSLANSSIGAINKEYDYIIYSGGHQIRKQLTDIHSSKLEAYPVSDVYNKLDKILSDKVKSGISPVSIDIKIRGVSLSGIDSVFSINSWLENGKITNPELFNKVKINMTLSSRSLSFPTARVTEMPKNPINDEMMLNLCRKAYRGLKNDLLTSSSIVFERQMLKLYVDIVNVYRKKLCHIFDIDLKPLTFDEIFNSTQQRCESVSEIRDKTLCSITRATDRLDLEYLINQTCFKMSSKYGTYLFSKLAKHNLGEAYRTAYTNNVTPVPVVTLKRFLHALDNPSINTSVTSEFKDSKNNYDITLDASSSVRKINDQDGVIQNLLNSDKITKSGTSKIDNLLLSGNNKITTAFVGGSVREGTNAGHATMLGIASSHSPIKGNEKHKISWLNDLSVKITQSKLSTSLFADTVIFGQKEVSDKFTKLYYKNNGNMNYSPKL